MEKNLNPWALQVSSEPELARWPCQNLSLRVERNGNMVISNVPGSVQRFFFFNFCICAAGIHAAHQISGLGSPGNIFLASFKARFTLITCLRQWNGSRYVSLWGKICRITTLLYTFTFHPAWWHTPMKCLLQPGTQHQESPKRFSDWLPQNTWHEVNTNSGWFMVLKLEQSGVPTM